MNNIYIFIILILLIGLQSVLIIEDDIETKKILKKINDLDNLNQNLKLKIDDNNFHLQNISNNIKLKNNDINDFYLLSIINKKFMENHIYSESYTCVNYTIDYGKMLQHLGYDVSTVIGSNTDNAHAWNKVCFDIEPQTGEIINYESEYSKIKSKNLEFFENKYS